MFDYGNQEFHQEEGIVLYDEYQTYMKLYGFEGKHNFLPKFVCDWFFLVEFYKQYDKWSILYDHNNKKKLTSTPLKCMGFIVKIIKYLEKITKTFSSFGLKEA